MNQNTSPPSGEIPGESVSQTSIYAQLARIHASPRFARSPRLCQLLSHLVEHSASGNPRELLEFTIGVDVFGRGESFDPKSDTIVRVTVRRLRRFLADYYAKQGRDDPVVLSIPTGHYRVDFLLRQPDANSLGRTPFNKHWRLWFLSAAAAILALVAGIETTGEAPPTYAPEAPADSPAMQHILLGQQLMHRRGPGDLQQAVTEFEQAVADDEHNVDAWIGLTSALAVTGLQDPRRNSQILPRQYWAINKALALAPAHPEANARMASLHFNAGDGIGAARYMRRALVAEGKNNLVLSMIAGQERISGNLELALELQRKANNLPPLDSASLNNLAYMLYEAGELDEALDVYHRLEKMSPRRSSVKAMIVKLLLLRGELSEAERKLREVAPGAERQQALALLYYAVGQAEESRQAARTLAEQASTTGENIMLAEVFAFRGETARAMDQIETTFAQIVAQDLLPAWKCEYIRTLLDSPYLASIHDSPRFLEWANSATAFIAGESPNLLTLASLQWDNTFP